MHAGTAHLPFGQIVHEPSTIGGQSWLDLHVGLELGQVKAQLESTQSKLAQLPSMHGLHSGGGVPQSIAVWHIATAQLAGPGLHRP